MSQQNNSRELQENESRSERRGPLRRQAHLIDHQEEERNSPPVPEEIRPFLNMIELEERNPLSTSIQESFTNPETQYKTIHPSQLQVRLHPESTLSNSKETVYEKILIYGIVWHKDISGLFDYEQKDKNQKSSIVIEDDVRSHINFVSGYGAILPRADDCFLVIFKTKLRKMVYEKSLLKDVRIAALRRHLSQSKQANDKEDKNLEKEFLCAFKLVMNSMTNQFTIKVYSFDELSEQVKMVEKVSEQKKARKIEFKEQIENIQIQSSSVQDLKPEVPHLDQPLTISLDHEKRQSSEPYFIIRTLSKNSPTQSLGYKLYPGDLIKMGKIEYKAISIDGVSVEDKNSEYDRRAIEVTQIGEEEEKDIECKYCLGGKSEEAENFFVHLCDCRGHIGYVHYNCLATWTTTRASIQTADNVKMYYLEKMKCEVCTKEFPKYFRYDNKLYHILPIDLPKQHLMLVEVSQRHDANTAVITGVEGNSVIIGRGRGAHLRVTDITVSREHATITRIGDDYYIKDCKSKFGTLVRSTETQIETQIQHKKGFQINNVIFTVQIIKKEVQKERQAERSSEKVLTFESIREEKEGCTQANESMRQNTTSNSFSTMLKRMSETDRNQGSFDLEKLDPNISLRQVKRQMQIQDENNAILEEQDEQTRTTKKNVHLANEGRKRGAMQQRISELRKQIQKRMIDQQLERQEQEIELQNCQNTTNINNHQNELIQLQKSKKSSSPRQIQSDDDENVEP